MSVKIRLRRMGAKSQPSYRLVVTDSRNPRDGRFIETIGFYNPRRNPPEIRLQEEKALDWLRRGAIPSDTARSLLRRGGVWSRFTEGGIVTPERREALAARKERATARRAARRAGGGTAGPRSSAARSSEAPVRARAGRGLRQGAEKPTDVEDAAGRKHVVVKEEGMTPVSKKGRKTKT